MIFISSMTLKEMTSFFESDYELKFKEWLNSSFNALILKDLFKHSLEVWSDLWQRKQFSISKSFSLMLVKTASCDFDWSVIFISMILRVAFYDSSAKMICLVV